MTTEKHQCWLPVRYTAEPGTQKNGLRERIVERIWNSMMWNTSTLEVQKSLFASMLDGELMWGLNGPKPITRLVNGEIQEWKTNIRVLITGFESICSPVQVIWAENFYTELYEPIRLALTIRRVLRPVCQLVSRQILGIIKRWTTWFPQVFLSKECTRGTQLSHEGGNMMYNSRDVLLLNCRELLMSTIVVNWAVGIHTRTDLDQTPLCPNPLTLRKITDR